jgi:hypothetical protein
MRWFLLALVLSGCVRSMIPELEARRAAALRVDGAAPTQWEPDARLWLSTAAVDQLLEEALRQHGTLQKKVSIGSSRAHIHPDLEITAFSASPSRRCADCAQLSLDVEGHLSWDLGFAAGRAPLAGSFTLAAVVEGERGDKGLVVRVRPQRVEQVELAFTGRMNATTRQFADIALQQWVQDWLVPQMAPIPIVSFDPQGLPLIAARVSPARNGWEFQLLSDAAERGVAPAVEATRSDWSMTLAKPTVLALARRESFQQPVGPYGVVADPLDLTVDGERYQLVVRVWRTQGRVWWRDYAVDGIVQRSEQSFDLTASQAEDRGRSPGARWADPLAAIAEGRILKSVESVMQRSLPGGTRSSLGGLPVRIEVTTLDGHADGFVLSGRMSLNEEPRGRRSRGPGR